VNVNTAPGLPFKPMIFAPIFTSGPLKGFGSFADADLINISHTPSNSLENSEFGARYSTLLPIGNGLQTSLIYLWEYRNSRGVSCECLSVARSLFPTVNPATISEVTGKRGVYLVPGHFIFGRRPGVPKIGTLAIISQTDYRRNSFYGVTGTYYDKDLTDIVYRYDVLYTPSAVVGTTAPDSPSGSAWTEFTRFILAGDRPTYIPWISKQHTFLTAQYVNTWYPDRPTNATFTGGESGKVREISNFAFIAATNWLMNGQLTALNALSWDIDDNVGFFGTTNVYRYSRNVLFGVNAQWFLGQSGRKTDPFLFSNEQTHNELEFTFTYEI